ncbi:anti-sigma factor family protein [Neorhizobium alkalisoli]|uniref:Anti-sigma factor RsiW n=1 Tax=Neorhizobium alkalisoli TaxID=528178 RepID=A0A561QVG2_9HYPH|nr:anti-sigma factor [Neorhizobium alkalisoli]TWF54306.1 anti-sigma factor RsiW [Neorhizobium alkalisoli]
MNENRPVSEAELHAYVDGFLGEEDSARVEAHLAANPDLAGMVADWQAQSAGLQAAFAGAATPKENDIRLISDIVAKASKRPASQPRHRLALAASAILVFGLGLAAGHYGPKIFEAPQIELTATEILPREARDAFLIYASEVRHPVEVFANEEAHLATWLGKKLSVANLKVPNLQTLGFRLVGGRLLPVDGRPGAMFMYEDGSGQRITVLVARNAENRTTSFRFASADEIETFYWIDGDLGYAVTGEISRDMLQKIAEECYRQFPS